MTYRKYNNKKTQALGRTWDSQGEYKRALFLLDAQRQGIISGLEYQKRFDIVINDVKVCFYKADFVYMKEGLEVVEDFKGMVTPIFNLKKKLLKACLGVEIKVVKKPTEVLQ